MINKLSKTSLKLSFNGENKFIEEYMIPFLGNSRQYATNKQQADSSEI